MFHLNFIRKFIRKSLILKIEKVYLEFLFSFRQNKVAKINLQSIAKKSIL